MLLEPKETVLRSAYAVRELPAPERRRRAGVLYLTTERLVFEAPAQRGLVRGLVTGREVVLDVVEPLRGLRNTTVRSGRIARDRLVVEGPTDRLVFDVLEPGAWSAAIADARQLALAARTEAPARGGAVGRAGVVKIRCRYCGGLGDEDLDRCPSCGAPL